jgi:hypothetical protein
MWVEDTFTVGLFNYRGFNLIEFPLGLSQGESEIFASNLVDKMTPVSISVVMTIDTFHTQKDGGEFLSVDNTLPDSKSVHLLGLHSKQVPFAQEDLRHARASGGERNVK